MPPDDGKLRQWAAQRIGSLLMMPPENCEEIVENILAYDDSSELQDFLAAFTTESAEFKVTNFVQELFERRNMTTNKEQPEKEVPKEAPKGGKKGGRGRGRDDDAGRGRARGDGGRGKAKEEFPTLIDMPMQPRAANDKRLMVVDSASGRHNVLTNCMNCGKVIAEEEGWGPCLFCGNPLEVGDRFGMRHGDDRGFVDSVGRQQCTEEEKYNKSFEKAVETKNRLISYDQDAKKRTKVYDDATDWYSESVNPWLSEKQREEAMRKGNEAEQRKREEKRKMHLKIDVFGRTVVSTDAEHHEVEDRKDREKLQEWNESIADQNKLREDEANRARGGTKAQLSGDSQQLYDKLRASLHAMGRSANQYGTAFGGQKPEKGTRWDSSIDSNRVENEFTNVSTDDFRRAPAAKRLLPVEESPYVDADDEGHCLSMHQPQASLLVHGFKRAEGRGWPSNHRGRLWIHAAGKPPEDHDIDMLEQQYRSIYDYHGVPTPPLPSECGGYPTSALIGCIDMEQCWTAKDYKQVLADNPQMPQEENSNDYIFWCLRPRRLVVPLKMGGDHKIWRIPKPTLAAAQRGLQPVRWPAPEESGNMLSSPSIAQAGAAAAGAPAAATVAAAEPKAPAKSSAEGSKASRAPAAGSAGAGASKPLPSLDLWPVEAPSERLEMVERDKGVADRDAVVLQNGFVHLIGFVPPDVQQRIIDELREVGSSERGFFSEQFDGKKVSTGVMRMYLGKHWNAASQRWEGVRGNLDKGPVLDLPKIFATMYGDAVQKANREFARGPNKKRKFVPFPEGRPPDLGVVNFYTPSGNLQMHQDNTESKESIDAGFPVMGICIGDSCDFTYGTEAPSAARKPKAVRLESGDAYLFGGESRLMWHGVPKVLRQSAPPSLRLVPGRLSVTLRVH